VAQPYPSGARDAQVMDLSFQSVSGVFAGYVIDLLLLARTIRAQRLSTVILNSFADDTVARKHRRVRAIPSWTVECLPVHGWGRAHLCFAIGNRRGDPAVKDSLRTDQ